MAKVDFTGELTNQVTNSTLLQVDEYARGIEFPGGSPSPRGIYNIPTHSGSTCSKWISHDTCSPSTLDNSCKTSSGVSGRCRTNPSPTSNTCIYRCVSDIPRNTIDIPLLVNDLEEYWQSHPELMNPQYIDNSNSTPYWVISPTPSSIDVVCSHMCTDTNRLCDNPSQDIDTFCSDHSHNDCCVCNTSRWDQAEYFVGETMPTSIPFPTYNFPPNGNIPPTPGNKLHTTFNIPTPTKLGFKKVKKGYIKPYNHRHECFFPLPSSNISSTNPPTIDSYRYRSELTHNERNQYAFARPIVMTRLHTNPKLATFVLSDDEKINIDDGTTANQHLSVPFPTDYFYQSSPTSILGKKGYYEECLYGKMTNGVCPTECPEDMISPTRIGKNTICTRCGHNMGKVNSESTVCSSCSDINQIPNIDKGYGCIACPANQYFDKNSLNCNTCPSSDDKVLTICQNKGNNKCDRLLYSIDLPDNDKNSFYENCLSDNNCEVNETCINDPTTIYNLPLETLPLLNRVTGKRHQYHNNLYMNEVCKTNTSQLECDLIKECRWFSDSGGTGSNCYLDIPSPTSNNIIIPMTIPPNISDPTILRSLNNFSTPSPSTNMCYSTQGGELHSVSEFWGDSPPGLPRNAISCQGVPSIHIPNSYTNSELNVYALPQISGGSSQGFSECIYKGCVDLDKYYRASIPETIPQVCNELDKVYHSLNPNQRILPISGQGGLTNIIANPSQYGCLFIQTELPSHLSSSIPHDNTNSAPAPVAPAVPVAPAPLPNLEVLSPDLTVVTDTVSSIVDNPLAPPPNIIQAVNNSIQAIKSSPPPSPSPPVICKAANLAHPPTIVNVADLLYLLGKFGNSQTNIGGDLTGDNKIDIEDLLKLLANFGHHTIGAHCV